jgi:hypothetical protein
MHKTVAIFSDTHAGHRLGLMNPAVQLLDEDENGQPAPHTPSSTAVQRWLWNHYQNDATEAWVVAGDDPLIAIHNGDICWGTRFPKGLVSNKVNDQIAIAVANMQPWLQIPNLTAMRFVTGTGAHEFGEGVASASVASALAQQYPAVNIAECTHLLLNVDGVLMDIAHHGPPVGARIWLSGGQLRAYVTSLMLESIVRGVKPPDVVVRAHYHFPIHETVRVGEHTCEAFVLPCYCGMTHFACQMTRSAYMLGCGMVVLEVEDGKLAGVHDLHRFVDLRREEKL